MYSSWQYFHFIFFVPNLQFLSINKNASFSYKHFYMIRLDESICAEFGSYEVCNKYRKYFIYWNGSKLLSSQRFIQFFVKCHAIISVFDNEKVVCFIYIGDNQWQLFSIHLRISLLSLQRYIFWQDRNKIIQIHQFNISLRLIGNRLKGWMIDTPHNEDISRLNKNIHFSQSHSKICFNII